MTSWILGINAYHADSAACLVRDGALVAAAEEERFRRVKHWAGFPSEAIRYCLAEGGIADVPLAGLGGTAFLSAQPRQITLPQWAVRIDGGKTQGRSWKHPKS